MSGPGEAGVQHWAGRAASAKGSPGATGPLLAQAGPLVAVGTPLAEVAGPAPSR